jgi:hypothetical protein
VIIGFVIVFDPHILTANVHWGIAPTWGNFALAIPVAMIAYTGIETVSNLAEEARDPTRSIPASIRLVAVAVFAIYFTLPLVALSALPVYKDAAGDYVTKLGLPPDQGGFENDPVLGLVENLGLHGWVLSAGKVYVGILAATILFIATNAGVIGASRITYSMAMHRQLPEVFRRLHPRFKTPWLSLIVFAAAIPIAVLLPGGSASSGRCTRSARCCRSRSRTPRSSSSAARSTSPGPTAPGRTSASATSTCPLFALLAGSARRLPGSSWSSSIRRRVGPASAGWRAGSCSTGCTGPAWSGSPLLRR